MRFVLGKSMGCSGGGQRPRGGARADLTSGAGAQVASALTKSTSFSISPGFTRDSICYLSICLSQSEYLYNSAGPPRVSMYFPCLMIVYVDLRCVRQSRLSRVPPLAPRALSYSANICHSVSPLHGALSTVLMAAPPLLDDRKPLPFSCFIKLSVFSAARRLARIATRSIIDEQIPTL